MDIFTCAAADGPFKGTYTSSFSDTISRLRELASRKHENDDHVLTDAQLQMKVNVHTPGGHKEHSLGSPRTTYDVGEPGGELLCTVSTD